MVGVQLCFVLSGFLITSLVLAEYADTRRIDVRAFYARRIRRLLPALVAVSMTFTWSRSWRTPGRRTLAAGSVLRSFLYIETSAASSGSTPMDGLVILGTCRPEEQFYLVWPLALLVSIRRWGRRGVAGVAIGVFVATVVGRQVLGDPDLA